MLGNRCRAALGLGLAVGLALATAATAAPTAREFADPVRLTSPGVGGFEPGIRVDRFGNIYVTAHKDRQVNAVAPDASTARGVRGASYLWTSTDSRTFRTLTPDSPYVDQPGIEGDLALDDAGNLYFVDTYAGDVAFTAWSVSGPGRQRVQLHRQVLGQTQAMEDRPWLAAKGNGTVLYTVNSGASPVYAGRSSAGDGSGPGRYTVYMSYDGGRAFDPVGVTLRDSGWCGPAADHAPQSRDLYVVCIDVDQPGQVFDRAIYGYSSHDDGRSWARTRIGTYSSAWWPTTAVGPDGTVWVALPDGPRVRLFASRDRGRTWGERKVPLPPGLSAVGEAALAVSSRGDVAVLGTGTARGGPTHVFASTLSKGTWRVVQVSTPQTRVAAPGESSRGEFFQAAYGPDGRLHVVWGSNTTAISQVTTGVDLHDVYYAVTR